MFKIKDNPATAASFHPLIRSKSSLLQKLPYFKYFQGPSRIFQKLQSGLQALKDLTSFNESLSELPPTYNQLSLAK